MDINKVTLIGRLPQDPELRTIPSGAAVASFAVATSRQWKDKAGERQKQTEFTRVVAWEKLATMASESLHKGEPVEVEGRLHTGEWVGKDGAKKQRTEVVAEKITLPGDNNQSI